MDEIRSVLVAYPHPELPEPDAAWLRRRYAEVAEVAAAEALRTVESGEPLPETCLQRVRALGARRHGEQIPLGVALRAAAPALELFAGLLPRTAPATSVVVWMQRASAVLQELDAAWMEGWLQGGAPAAVPTPAADVEPQEQEILRLVAGGRSNDEIAEATHYSRQAIVWQLSRLMRRWRAPNRAALVAAAFAKGVLVPGSLPGPT